jgi:hypothetical protein
MTEQAAGFARFSKYMVIGAVISGVASGIPLLGALNCCFCLLNMAGIVLALSMYLKSAPDDLISGGEAAGFGAAAGAGAGLISGIMSLVFNMLLGSVLASVMANLPEASRSMFTQSAALGVIMIPINIGLFAAFGALGGFLGMQLFFKTRIKKA